MTIDMEAYVDLVECAKDNGVDLVKAEIEGTLTFIETVIGE